MAYQQPAAPQPGYAAPPPAAGYPAPPPATVVVSGQPQLSFEPTVVTCPHCQQNVQTQVNYETGLITWLSCGGLVLLGCWLGCCFIPMCVNELKDAQHSCPSCHKIIGLRKRMWKLDKISKMLDLTRIYYSHKVNYEYYYSAFGLFQLITFKILQMKKGNCTSCN